MINFFKRNIGFFLFVFVLFILTIGVVATSESRHLDKMLIVFVTFVFSYFLTKKIFFRFRWPKLSLFDKIGNQKYLPELLLILCIAIFIIDIIDYGGIPVLKIRNIETVKELIKLREEIHINSHILLIYLYGWNIKALMPFALVLFFCTNRKWLFYILLTLSCFYAFSMMQKSFILAVLFPVSVVMFYRRKYLHFLTMIFIAGITIFSSVIMSSHIINTDMDYNPNAHLADNSSKGKITAASVGISKRVFIVPGEMVAGWFDIIPEKKPFLNGNGYGVLAKLRNHQTVDYSVELYPILRPEYVKKGLSGTVNVATFMRSYSNFGISGMIISCIFLAAFFVVLEQQIFPQYNKEFFIAINLFPILLLSSGNVLTLLFSGGWAVLILLFLLFKTKLIPENQFS